jgi:hypothetical protein
MERIQKPDTAYQDNSQPAPLAPPFTNGAVRRARQVVALRPDFLKPFRVLWESLGTGTHRARLLGGIVLVALAGGMIGALLAAANRDHEPGIDPASLTTGANAQVESSNPQPVPKSKGPEPKSRVAAPGPDQEFEEPEMESLARELRKRPSSRAKKAYRVAIIYPRDYEETRQERKRGRRH